ncbi:MAG: hypothetical protein ACYS0G_11515 [Planctomycetota bacterium]
MHETRNFLLVILLIVSVVWTIVSWFVFGTDMVLVWPQRVLSPLAIIVSAAWLFYAFRFEDKLPDRLKQAIGDIYYDADGLSFMPFVRARDGRAELCVYYQNRYENPAEAIVHLRPPADSFIIRPGMRDVHITFKASGGDFGIIHQRIAVPEHLQGEVINVHLAATSYYPRSHGARHLRHAGLPCGTLLVDWGGAAFKSGFHEVSGEIELINAVTLHLSMPSGVRSAVTGDEAWKQELLSPGRSQ